MTGQFVAAARLGILVAFVLLVTVAGFGAGSAGAGSSASTTSSGRAMALAQTGGAPAQGVPADASEVVSLRTRNSRTYSDRHGAGVLYGGPVNYRTRASTEQRHISSLIVYTETASPRLRA